MLLVVSGLAPVSAERTILAPAETAAQAARQMTEVVRQEKALQAAVNSYRFAGVEIVQPPAYFTAQPSTQPPEGPSAKGFAATDLTAHEQWASPR